MRHQWVGTPDFAVAARFQLLKASFAIVLRFVTKQLQTVISYVSGTFRFIRDTRAEFDC